MNTMRLLFFLIIVVGVALFFRAGNLSPNQTSTSADEAVKSAKSTQISQNSTPRSSISPDTWRYPGSSVRDGVLVSTDEPTTVTSWYKEKMKRLGYRSLTSLQTTTNGHVENQLIGTKDDTSRAISITKKLHDDEVVIIIR